MTDKIQDLHPSRLIDGDFGRFIPGRLRRPLRIVIVAIAWYGLINGALGILASLKWVIDFGVWITRQSGLLAAALRQVADVLHAIVASWRALTEPLYSLLFSWWPLHVPREVLDLVVIASILAGGYVRGLLLTSRERRLARAISSAYTHLGRIALVKRLSAGLDIIEKFPHNRELVAKGEGEVRAVLVEMRPRTAEGDKVFREVLSLPTKEMQKVLRHVADAPVIAAQMRTQIMLRSAVIGGALLAALAIDAIYIALK